MAKRRPPVNAGVAKAAPWLHSIPVPMMDAASAPRSRMLEILARLKAALADRYAIDRELGHGGTATVYLAQDLKHGRSVAVKVLRPELAAALGAERFLREIEIAARLTHPHILPLHDSGEAAGFLYYVMPFVQGESLRDRLHREPQLPIDEAVKIAREVATALSYAHSQDVVHRDIKPENILLSGGEAVVADFGIARAIVAAGAEQLTDTGLAVGTPGYMSPEQATGAEHLDGRSDVYSLGCVLYEMLAGHPPFLGTTAQEILARHTLDPVPPLRTIRPELPAAVDRAVGKALAKAPADRFATAAPFVESMTQASTPPSFARRAARPAVFVAAGVAALVTGYVLLTRRSGSSDEPGPSIAVLPFKNIGGDVNNEPFSDGMTDEITTALGKVEGLRVAARSVAFRFKGKNVVPEEIGRQLHVLYLQGRYFFAKRDSASLRKAQEYFESAIHKDSTYALAWSGLSDAYSHRAVWGYVAPHDIFPKAKAAALRARALDSTLVEVHTSLGFIAQFYDWDWPTAGREFDQALRIDPRYAEAHLFHAWYFVATNRMDEAVSEVQTAVTLDPFSVVNNARLASMLFYARRYNETLAQSRHLLELDSTSVQGRVELARAYLQLGRCAEALAALEQGPGPAWEVFPGLLGQAYATCGHRTQALARLSYLGSAVRAGRYVPHFAFARIYAGLADTDRGLAELDSAYVERAWPMFTLRVEPAFDGLRADPRFVRLLKKVGLVS